MLNGVRQLKKGKPFWCMGCNKNFKAPKWPYYWPVAFNDGCVGDPPEWTAWPVCARCWRNYWYEMQKHNPWIEGGLPFVFEIKEGRREKKSNKS